MSARGAGHGAKGAAAGGGSKCHQSGSTRACDMCATARENRALRGLLTRKQRAERRADHHRYLLAVGVVDSKVLSGSGLLGKFGRSHQQRSVISADR